MEPEQFDELYAADLIDNSPEKQAAPLIAACAIHNAALLIAAAHGAELGSDPWMTPEKLTGEEPAEEPDRRIPVDQFEQYAAQMYGGK